MLRMAVDIYGDAEAKEDLEKVEGEEFVLDFPTLDGAIVLKPQGNRILASVGDSENPTSRFIFKVKEEKVFDVLEDVTKSSGKWGLIKLFFKYILLRRIRIKGSLRKAMSTLKAMTFGNFEEDSK